MSSIKLALVGNPNCGKTTLFNRLTGSNQSVGNWPGVTVAKKEGRLIDSSGSQDASLVDLPGIYSLVPCPDMPLDEQITCDYCQATDNTIFINVIDASHLHRDLYLSLQLLALGKPVVVALNCMDLAAKAGVKIDVAALAQELGCPVVPIVAKTGQNLDALKQAISLDLNPVRAITHHYNSDLDYAQQLRRDINKILSSAVEFTPTQTNLSERIDTLVLHKFFGPMIFVAVMYLMFTLAINVGGLLQGYFETVAEQVFIFKFAQVLAYIGADTWLIDILTKGLGLGISITLTFIPVLWSMFMCLGILESTGYMMRAAFIVDRLMQFIGLPGKAFVPMIVGFGCNVPAVMAARTLANKRERILTIMMTPFMSCSARLAIYAIFVAAFFPLGGQNVIFSLYLVGIMVAILTGLALRTAVLPQEQSNSLQEMPDYRWPLLSSLLRQAWWRLRGFLTKASLLIILLCIIINGVGPDNLAKVGKLLTPAFAPIGISADNWPASVGLLTGLIAKEAVIGTLNSAYGAGASLDQHLVQHFGGATAAYAYLLFTLLYFPCASVVAVIAKELNKKWAAFSVIWSTSLAYIIAALYYQAATWDGLMSGQTVWILVLSLVLTGLFISARKFVSASRNPRASFSISII